MMQPGVPSVSPDASSAPQWLVEFLLTPPWWFKATLFVLVGAVIALTARRIYRRDIYISVDEHLEMVLILATLEAIAVGVVLSINLLSLGFIGDVTVGFVGGFAVVEVARRCDWLLPGGLDDDKGKAVTAWGIVALTAFAAPDLLYPHNRPYYLGMKVGIAGISMLMAIWMLIQEFGPKETIGEAIREGRTGD